MGQEGGQAVSANFEYKAKRSTYFSKPADTNTATMYTVGTGIIATVEALSMTADGASTATVWISDGSTDWLVQNAESLAQDTHHTETFGQPVMRAGWSVKVKSSVASKVTYMLTVAEELNRE